MVGFRKEFECCVTKVICTPKECRCCRGSLKQKYMLIGKNQEAVGKLLVLLCGL